MDEVIFTETSEGRVVAISNWRQRHSPDDVCITVPLDAEQERIYRRALAQGMAPQRLYRMLFESEKRPVATTAYSLSDAQMRALIEQYLGVAMPSLAHMERADLLSMVSSLGRHLDPDLFTGN